MAPRAAPDLRDLMAAVADIQTTLVRLEDQGTRTDARADETVRLNAKLGAQVEQLSHKVDVLSATQTEDREQSLGDRREIKQLVTSAQSLTDRRLQSLEAKAEAGAHSAATEASEKTVAGISKANRPMRLGIYGTGGVLSLASLGWVWTNWDQIWHRFQAAAKFVAGIDQ